MLTQFPKLISRAIAGVLPILLSTFALTGGASAQTLPAITNSPVAVPHMGTFGNLWQSAVSTRGDFVVYDFKTDGLYEFPATGGPEIVIAAPGVIAGGFTNSGIAIDPRNNNIYLDNNYNGGLLEFPFNPVTQAWDLPKMVVASNLNGTLSPTATCGNYFQSVGLAINASGVLAVATENGCGVEIFTVPIDASGNFGTATPILGSMTARAKTLAIDNAGNISFNEDAPGLQNAYFIPAGTTGLVGEPSAGEMRVDLLYNTTTKQNSNVQGVTVDAVGNIYVADGTVGSYMVPLVAGKPNPGAAVMISTIPAAGGPSIDPARGTLFYQITTSGTISDIVKIFINRNELGSVPVANTTPTPATVNFLFSNAAAPPVTPYTISIQQDGVAGVFTVGDQSGCGITFPVDPNTMKVTEKAVGSYSSGSTCSIVVNFMPTVVGKSTATLLVQDMSGKVLSTSVLHGSGAGSDVAGLPDTETTFGTGLKAPSQITVDYAGNTYVADSGLGKVLQYAPGSTATSTGTPLGTGLVAPTGVAVDGIGNVFISDSGKVVEIPYGPKGLVAANQVTLKTGLGARTLLAADGIGDLFVADISNQTLVRLRTNLPTLQEVDTPGFTQLSAIAADGAGDVFLANGQSLIELSAAGTQTLTNTLVNATSIAVDHSGSVYVTSPTQTVRIPYTAGALKPSNQMVLATTATKPAAVAVDFAGNAYVADAGGGNVVFSSSNSSVNLGKLATATATSTQNVTLYNTGNLPLTITGFGSTADYSVTTNSCVGSAIAVGAACNATVTFNPGPGDQGLIQAALAVQGNEVNTPSVINVSGTGVLLANSTSSISVVKPTVTSATVTVAVAPATGTAPVPTGNVTVVVTGLAPGSTPITSTQPLINGAATFVETTLQAGNLTFTVNYGGDRVYLRSTASTTVPVAVGMGMLIQPAASTVPTYVLASGAGSQEPYDSSQLPFYYTYPVTFKAVNGAPLVGIPVFNSATPPVVAGANYGTVTYQLANGTSACAASSIINTAADGTSSLGTQCFAINTSNNQIPNIITSYTVTPVYAGPNYAPVTGTPVTFIAIRNPMVIITSNPGSLSVAAGTKASTTLTLTSLLGYGITGSLSMLNNYSLPVEMGCDALPAHATCSFSYPTPDPSDVNATAVTPTTPGTVVMTLNTNQPVGTTQSSVQKPAPGYFVAMLGLGLVGAMFGRRKTLRTRMLSLVIAFLFTSAVFGLTACSSANISASPVLTTPKGTYMITVTAKQAGSKVVPAPKTGDAPITVYGNGNQMSIPFQMSVTIQ